MAKKSTKKRLSKVEENHLFGVKVNPKDPLGELIEDNKNDNLESAYEMVNHPKHYDLLSNGIECIDVIRHFDHNKGAAIKYIWRAGKKPGSDEVQDLQKAIWYLEDRIKEVQGLHKQMV